MSKGEFKKALTQLASDDDYRLKATKDPKLIEHDFKLTVKELHALREAAVLSGADVRAVDALRGKEIAARASKTDELSDEDEFSISCCSCCCCCCGETAVVAA
jgi:hypothetical protein